MIVDASVVIDAVADPGERGDAARTALADHPAFEPLVAPGILSFEVLSGLRAAAGRPGHPMNEDDLEPALRDAAAYEIRLDAIPWEDVERAWELSEGSLRYPDAVYVAAAERLDVALLTSDARIERSGATFDCEIVTVRAAPPRA